MPHRVIKDTHVFPRINKDVERHNKRVREAIRKNLSKIVAQQDIITADKDKKIRVPIKQLKEWSLRYNSYKRTQVGHGDALKRITCPNCDGEGCTKCKGIGTLPIIYNSGKNNNLYSNNLIDEISSISSEINIEDHKKIMDEIEKRKGKSGKPRSLKNDKIGKVDKENSGGGIPVFGGNEDGIDEYETDISIAELENIMFETLHLPNLEDKGFRKILRDTFRFDEIRKNGPISSIDKKRSIKENIKRNAKEKGRAYFGDIDKADLRYRRWEVDEEEEACAVIFAIMDTSGSMTEYKKYIARSFYHWMKRFLETQYDAVEIVFIAHHTDAKEVSEEEFFHKVESGGTMMSSGWKLANKIMQERYSPSQWNIYAFHFSDGENFSYDNDELVSSIKESIKYPVNMVGYGEITDDIYKDQRFPSWMMPQSIKDLLNKEFVSEKKFLICEINEEGDIWRALKTFFSKDHEKVIRKLEED